MFEFFLFLTIVDLIIPDPIPVLDELAFIYLTYISWLHDQEKSK